MNLLQFELQCYKSGSRNRSYRYHFNIHKLPVTVINLDKSVMSSYLSISWDWETQENGDLSSIHSVRTSWGLKIYNGQNTQGIHLTGYSPDRKVYGHFIQIGAPFIFISLQMFKTGTFIIKTLNCLEPASSKPPFFSDNWLSYIFCQLTGKLLTFCIYLNTIPFLLFSRTFSFFIL